MRQVIVIHDENEKPVCTDVFKEESVLLINIDKLKNIDEAVSFVSDRLKTALLEAHNSRHAGVITKITTSASSFVGLKDVTIEFDDGCVSTYEVKKGDKIN